MDKGTLIGSVSGLIIFICVILIFVYSHSDFDQELISSVSDGVSAEELIPQIQKEHEKQRLKSEDNLNSRLMDIKMWGNGELASDSYYDFYTHNYEQELIFYDDLEVIRIKYVRREISEEEFLDRLKNLNF